MPRIVKGGLIQCSVSESTEKPIEVIKKSMIDKHIALIEEAGKKGVQILCLQEIFFGPYFCAEQKTKWYAMVEKIPEGPTVKLMQEYAKKYSMAMVVPIYEEEMTGIYYNTAAVLDADGKYLGKYRKHHIPQVDPGFWEKFYFKPGNLGYLYLKHVMPILASIFATTGTFQKVRAFLDCMVRKSSLTHRRRLQDCRNIYGNSNNRHTLLQTDISSGRLTGLVRSPPGISENFTGKVISAIRGEKLLHKRAATRPNL